MTDSATRKRSGRPALGPKYPVALPRVMTTVEQRRAVDARQTLRGETLGETLRSIVDDGLALDAAFSRDPDLRADVEKITDEAGVPIEETLAIMLRFAVTQSRRRISDF